MFFKATWASLTSALATSTTPSVLTPNYFAINVWSIVIFSPQMNIWICPSCMESEVHKNSSNRSSRGIIQWIANKPPKLTCFTHYHFLGSHLDPLKHFLNFLCFINCPFSGYLGRWIALLRLFLPLMPHRVLWFKLGKYWFSSHTCCYTNYVGRSTSASCSSYFLSS
jgi:hypothetical protein